MYDYHPKMTDKATLTLFAILAVGLLGLAVAYTIIDIPQAKAGCEKGPAVNKAFQNSNGKCFDRGSF